MLAPPKKETAAELRARNDENDRRLISWVLTLQKALEENERAQREQNKEILKRLADIQLASPAASSSLSLNTASDIDRLKKLMAEGRQSTSRLTECVNGLVDIPFELAGLQRAVSKLASRPATAAQPPRSAEGHHRSDTAHTPATRDAVQ